MPRDRAFMRPFTRLAVLALFAQAGLAGSALAQNALGDGRALDKNLSTKGGGNSRVKDLESQIRFNNQIIEGQAGGGRSFRGNLGYRATNEFGGSLGGTDSLYSFKRDSISSALATVPGLRTSDALQYQFGLSGGGAGRVSSATLNALAVERPGAISTGGTAAPPPPSSLSAAAISSLRSTAQYQSNAALLPTILGYAGNDEVGRVALTASPLRGIAQVGLATDDPNAPTPAGGNPSATSLTGMERRAFGVLPLSSPKAPAPRDANGQLSMPIDQRLGADGSPYRAVLDDFSRAIDQRIQPGDAPGANPANLNPANPNSDANPSGQSPSGAKPGAKTGAKPGEAANPADPARPSWMNDLDRLREKLKSPADPLKSKDKEKDKDKEGSSNPSSPTAPAAPGASPTGASAEPSLQPGPVSSARPPKLGDMKALPTDEPILETLKRVETRIATFKQNPEAKPEKVSEAYARRMAEGEDRMKAGEYFNAEGSFSLAIVANPADVMAQVGRAHAQLGAGLLLSSSGNLRSLFAEHPEMIPVRYGPNLLPSVDRAEYLVSRIRAEMNKPDSGLGADGALLTAYLGRQLDRGEWVREGLAGMAERTRPEDARAKALLGVLREVWIAKPAPGPTK